MTSFVFNEGAMGLLDASIVFGSDTIKARLVAASESIDKDADVMTGIGLAGFDATLANKTGPVKDDANDRVAYDNTADIVFVAVTAGTAYDRIILFKFVTNDADSVPLSIHDITPVTSNGGDITVTPAAAGLFYAQQ